MPEGPECKVYVDGLNADLKGQTVESMKIISGRYMRRDAPEGFDDFEFPQKLTRVGVKGKFIYFQFGDKYVWNTLGMTGCWSEVQDQDTRIILTYNGKKLYFGDKRNFGTFKFGKSRKETQAKLDTLGCDLLNFPKPVEASFDIFKLLRNARKTLPEILMDQKNYAGVGNYIKSEVLYRARLSPHRTGKSLSKDEIIKLHDTIKSVIQSSYKSKKAVLVNYNEMSECGQEFCKVVYKKNTDPYGNDVLAEETKDKRTTYWVPDMQF